jgi:hypothetical protein
VLNKLIPAWLQSRIGSWSSQLLLGFPNFIAGRLIANQRGAQRQCSHAAQQANAVGAMVGRDDAMISQPTYLATNSC